MEKNNKCAFPLWLIWLFLVTSMPNTCTQIDRHEELIKEIQKLQTK